MKKIISILILICTLILSLVSCGGYNDINNGGYNDNKPNCNLTGLHTYEQGECTGYKLKVFDVLKDYIMENGTILPSGYRNIKFGDYKVDEYYGALFYVPKDNCILINAQYEDGLSSSNISIELSLTPYTFEDGGYEWSARYNGLSISGILDPSKFSSSTSTLTHTSSDSDADYVAREACGALKGFIDNYLIDFTKNVGENLSIGSLGFKRYER